MREPIEECSADPAPSETAMINVSASRVRTTTPPPLSSQPFLARIWEVPVALAPAHRQEGKLIPPSPSLKDSITPPHQSASIETLTKATKIATEKARGIATP